MPLILVRLLRKVAHIGRRLSFKLGKLLQRIENKATRMIIGTDASFIKQTSDPFEKILYQGIPFITPLHPALPKRNRKPAVNLLLPSLHKGSFYGGTATALFAAATLAEKQQLDLRIIQTVKYGTAPVEAFLKESEINFTGAVHFLDVSGRTYNQYGYIDIHPDDVFMASAWWDAHLISHLPLKKKFVYLIQDYEPIFYNNSDQYVLAEATYHAENFVALCNTKLMYDFMVNRGYDKVRAGTWFEPAVSRRTEVTAGQASAGQKRRLFLYGRPNVARNLFFIALSAIDHCFASKFLDPNEWEIVMAGQDHIPSIELTSGIVVTNLGKMEFSEYLEFMGSVDVAVSLMMAPHPNYPTLEFASIGAGVVTTRYDIKQDLSRYSKNIIMADSSAESVSGAILKAASIPHAERLQNAQEANIGSNWAKALHTPIEQVIRDVST